MWSLVMYFNYFNWNHVGDCIRLQEAALHQYSLRYVCIYYSINTLWLDLQKPSLMGQEFKSIFIAEH